jgi:hypothetical protein
MTVLRHRSPRGTFSIRHVPMGHAVTYAWRLQFVIKVSTRSFFSMRRVPVGPFSIRLVEPDNLRVTCTCRACLHLHPTYGTRWLVCHLCLWTLLHLTCGTRRHISPSPSNLWDLTAPFSITIRPVGPNGLRVTCTCRNLLHLHLTCGTWRLACHLWTLSPFNSWDPMTYISCVPVGPFSISIRPMGPDGLCVTCCHWGLINSN